MSNSKIKKMELEEILEEDTLSFDKSEEFNIKYWSYNRSIAELFEMYQNKEIIIPDLQREYVWNYEQASLFIDSILRGLPIPSFFVTEINNKYLMIDGLQRLHTLMLYKTGQIFEGWSKCPKVFTLMKKSNIMETCAGKTFNDLDDNYQRKIDRAMMNIIEFNQISPSENYSAMYQIFERINSTGRALEPQEVRNAAYYSKFNHAVNEFADDEEFVFIYNSKKAIQRSEILVRWLTIKTILQLKSLDLYSKKQVRLKNDMNEFMAIFQSKEFNLPIQQAKFPTFYPIFLELNFDYDKELKKVKDVIHWIKENLGRTAFCNIKDFSNGCYTFKNTIHSTLAESIFIACYNSLEYLRENNKDYRKIFSDTIYCHDYQEKLLKQTTTIESITYRINALERAIKV